MPTLSHYAAATSDRTRSLNRGRHMSRRPFALLALSVVALSATACSEAATAPTSAALSVRQIQPSIRPALDVCKDGYITGTGRTC
jgi:hypothetical protein